MYSLTASIPIKTVLGHHPLLVCDYWTDPRAGKKVYDEVQANLASAPGPGQALGLMIIKWCSVLSPHLIWGHTVSGASIQVTWSLWTNQEPVSRSRDLLSVTRAQDGVIKDEDDDVDTSWQIFWPYSAPPVPGQYYLILTISWDTLMSRGLNRVR